MSETRRKYTKEFKLDAIALVEAQGFSVVQAAKSLDINENMLRRWIKQHREQGGEASFRGNGTMSAEQERIRKLERQVRELEMEKAILKKAAAFFAKEMK